MRIILIILSIFLPLSFSQAEDLTKEQAQYYRKEGYKLQSRGDLERALSFYQKAAKLDPSYTQIYNDIGVIYETQSRLGKAKEYYKKSLEINPNFMPAHTNLAFLYEKEGNIRKATDHWKKRYTQGKKGDYWHEVARQHLLKLGTYPEVKKEMIEKKAANLSKELTYQREQKRLMTAEEAKLHFRLGEKAFHEGLYSRALKELNIVLSLGMEDQELKNKSRKIVEQIKEINLRQTAFSNTKDALEYMENNDYLSAAEKLKDAFTAAFSISQKDLSQEE